MIEKMKLILNRRSNHLEVWTHIQDGDYITAFLYDVYRIKKIGRHSSVIVGKDGSMKGIIFAEGEVEIKEKW